MYYIIGADQKQYGPVPAEEVRKWIAEGRADGQTQAQAEGGGEWKPLAFFPEFAEALAAKARAAGMSPPKLGAAEADKLAAEIVDRDYGLDLGDCFSRSWSLLQNNFWLLVGATALIFVILLGIEFIPLLGHAAGVLFGFLLWGGLDLLFLKRLRGQPVEVGDVFLGFSLAFVQLMLASVVAHVLTGIGLLLCVLPGIYLLVVWWMFVPLLILDKGLEFWPAMELSRKVVTRHWWQCFGIFLLAGFVGLLGALACGVGVFFTLPIAVGATVYAYEDIFGSRAPTSELLAPAPPSGPAPTPATPSQPALTQTPQPEAGPTTSAPPHETSPLPATPPASNPPPAAPST